MSEGFESGPGNGGGAGDQAKERAQEAAGKAKNRLASEVDTRSTQAGEQLRSTADDVRGVAVDLREKGKDKPAELAERAAERVQRLGDYLHGSDGDRLVRDAEDFARSRPWAVALGGLVVGFAASRFLKASSGRRYEASRSGNGAPHWPAETSGGFGDRPSRVPPQPRVGADVPPRVPPQPTVGADGPTRVPPQPGVS